MRCGEQLGRVPVGIGDRHHHMNALAARKLDEAFEFSAFSRSRVSRAAATICCQATPSPGSRSNTMRSQVSRLSSREPRTWISSAPDCTSATRSSTVLDRNHVVILAGYDVAKRRRFHVARRCVSGRMFRRRRLPVPAPATARGREYAASSSPRPRRNNRRGPVWSRRHRASRRGRDG